MYTCSISKPKLVRNVFGYKDESLIWQISSLSSVINSMDTVSVSSPSLCSLTETLVETCTIIPSTKK